MAKLKDEVGMKIVEIIAKLDNADPTNIQNEISKHFLAPPTPNSTNGSIADESYEEIQKDLIRTPKRKHKNIARKTPKAQRLRPKKPKKKNSSS